MSEKVLMKGNEALAEAAIMAGCRHYFGYPITPQTEVAAYMSKRMPKIGGTFLQAESEIAAINMVILLVLAPDSVQEMVNLTFKAFDLAEKYRMPAMILSDGTMGQMMEPVSLEACEIHEHDKSWALTGTEGKRPPRIINSLFLKPEELEQFNFDRFKRYAVVEENEPMYEQYRMDDAEICIVAFGVAARVSQNAIDKAREMGIKVGMIRPITLWPFPKKALLAAADKVKAFISVELSMGQMIEDVELAIRCKKPVMLCNRVGGMIPTTENVLDSIKKASELGGANA